MNKEFNLHDWRNDYEDCKNCNYHDHCPWVSYEDCVTYRIDEWFGTCVTFDNYLNRVVD